VTSCRGAYERPWAKAERITSRKGGEYFMVMSMVVVGSEVGGEDRRRMI
jgi:hypothetical protein